MSEGQKTLHIIVKGSVQGVGFRASSKHHADKLNIRGCVKNLSDGSVEIYAQGTQQPLDEFVKIMKDGKGLAKVEHILVEEYSSPKNYPDFEILF